ncbi:flagellar hook-basal body complex protein FliE [Rubricella aquisinus]|uniref:Flagellar hook-basal body complex protein FliE n=1 Tax=Rubricella aquisinus TaxID=2028108 RepID=A0A840WVL2_9RHOB|nr:flagellar hook-basal body complex protein FliE [Rubricella aquisinus]MBB5515230.1 flagellar hook-basal body complex protein FliE [Rubricella aquisinus]
MDITSSLAARAYGATTAQKPETPGAVERTAKDFFATVKEGEETAMASLSGGADSQALVEALAQTELAVETAVTVRDRVVEAYQEILRMPV